MSERIDLVDGEGVSRQTVRAEANIQGLKVRIGDPERHLQPRDLRVGQIAGLDRGEVEREVHHVLVSRGSTAIDGQQAIDRRTVDGRYNRWINGTVRGGDDVDRVRPVAGVDGRRSIDRPHIDKVVATTAIQRHGHSVFRAVDREGVAKVTERDVEVF